MQHRAQALASETQHHLSLFQNFITFSSNLTMNQPTNGCEFETGGIFLVFISLEKGWVGNIKTPTPKGERKTRAVNQPCCSRSRDGASACLSRLLASLLLHEPPRVGRAEVTTECFFHPFFPGIVSTAEWPQASLLLTCANGCQPRGWSHQL